MNYGGDAADQIVRYSMEGMEHTLRISGSIAKNLAVFIVAVLKDQEKDLWKDTDGTYDQRTKADLNFLPCRMTV